MFYQKSVQDFSNFRICVINVNEITKTFDCGFTGSQIKEWIFSSKEFQKKYEGIVPPCLFKRENFVLLVSFDLGHEEVLAYVIIEDDLSIASHRLGEFYIKELKKTEINKKPKNIDCAIVMDVRNLPKYKFWDDFSNSCEKRCDLDSNSNCRPLFLCTIGCRLCPQIFIPRIDYNVDSKSLLNELGTMIEKLTGFGKFALRRFGNSSILDPADSIMNILPEQTISIEGIFGHKFPLRVKFCGKWFENIHAKNKDFDVVLFDVSLEDSTKSLKNKCSVFLSNHLLKSSRNRDQENEEENENMIQMEFQKPLDFELSFNENTAFLEISDSIKLKELEIFNTCLFSRSCFPYLSMDEYEYYTLCIYSSSSNGKKPKEKMKVLGGIEIGIPIEQWKKKTCSETELLAELEAREVRFFYESEKKWIEVNIMEKDDSNLKIYGTIPIRYLVCLRMYTGFFYKRVIKDLHGDFENMDKYKFYFECLLLGFQKIRKVQVGGYFRQILWRGTRICENRNEKLLQYSDSGSEIEFSMNRFMSCSSSRDFGMSYVKNALFRIEMKKEKKTGICIKFLSKYPGESEILVPPFTRFMVKRVERGVTIDDRKIPFYVELVEIE